MPPPSGLFLDFFKISFSHINLKYYLSEPDCQSWRGLKEIRKIFQLGYSWPNGMKKSFPKLGFCLCFTNCIQEDLNFVQTNEQQQQQKTVCCPPLAISRLGYSGLSYFFHHRDVKKRTERGDQHYKDSVLWPQSSTG